MLQDRFQVSQRRACRIVGQHRSTQRREVTRGKGDDALRARMHEFSRKHKRWGYRKAHALLREWRLSSGHKSVLSHGHGQLNHSRPFPYLGGGPICSSRQGNPHRIAGATSETKLTAPNGAGVSRRGALPIQAAHLSLGCTTARGCGSAEHCT